MPSYTYHSDFFDFVDASSGRSAARFLSRLDLGFAPASVLDVGCGRGVWLRAWKGLGAGEVLGVDGAYVDRATLQVEAREFAARDLTKPLDLGRAFDLVQCLEVAEHLPEAAADILVASLVRHGDVVLFSAAPPGQGGEHHVNEQPLPYWIAKFRAHGFAAYDHPRQAVRGMAEIEPWYRYNAMLFASERGAARLGEAARRAALPAGARIQEYAPLAWRVRCALVRALPEAASHWLARVKHRARLALGGGARPGTSGAAAPPGRRGT